MMFFILFASLSLGALYERIPQLTSKKEISVPAKSLFVLIKWDDVIVHIKKGNIEKVIDPSAKYTAFTANEACTVTCYPSGDATPILSYYIAQMPKNAPRKHYSYYSTQLTSKSSSKLKNYDYNFFYPGSFTVDFSITNTGTVTAISYDEKGKEKKSIYLSSGSGPVSTNNAFLMERDSDDGTITFNGDFTVKRTGDQDIPTIEFLWIMTGTIPEDGKFE
ncbi:hypothetical protein TRFO_20472 [Tritrichomonas foetus]|uniref:Uncharacterized protein n=1 Tax=Tritrichomonas foetus TaxID=1144522 RepID=A0A1J4KKW0_9EUKA|nr:hypothetical protein TRFO_20472 [Tritrichomonas foetus]|eukprot:OHT10334.1 hypothetical protein TRFO_20472 [Tritrichomonas foetus]